jgi:hypothetical protein
MPGGRGSRSLNEMRAGGHGHPDENLMTGGRGSRSPLMKFATEGHGHPEEKVMPCGRGSLIVSEELKGRFCGGRQVGRARVGTTPTVHGDCWPGHPGGCKGGRNVCPPPWPPTIEGPARLGHLRGWGGGGCVAVKSFHMAAEFTYCRRPVIALYQRTS